MKAKEKALVLGVLISSISCLSLGLSAQTYNPVDPELRTQWTDSVSEFNTHQSYPRPGMMRKNWINLNGLWKFSVTEPNEFYSKPDGNILVPFPIESSLSGVKRTVNPDQILWYKRSIILKKNENERILINFGAVDWQATLFINGKCIGNHTGGYTSFSFDITNAVKTGQNEILVRVYDPTDKGIGPHGKQTLKPANIYYTASSGIWQTVWIERVPKKYIESLTIVPDIDKSEVKVTVHSTTNEEVTLEVAGKTVRGTSNDIIRVPLEGAQLWSPDSPYLYNLSVSLATDQVTSYFGMRKIGIGKDEMGHERILLNNRPVYNLGVLDQGFWPDGLYTAPNDKALAFDIRAIKAMGFNTIRKHIKIEPDLWYYYADKIGMLVWQDFVNPNQNLPDGAKQQFEKESAEAVKQLNNHPSIVAWVLFNEKWGQFDQERLSYWLRKADPSRLVNSHSGELLYVNEQLRSQSPNAYAGSDMIDIHTYPKPKLPQKHAGKAMVIGEFGGIGVPVEGHLWDDLSVGWGYNGVAKQENLEQQYSDMVDTLVRYQSMGLSGSIYTQPFDVESEQNGLMTYDRKALKVPVQKLRLLNSKLLAQGRSVKGELEEFENLSNSLKDTIQYAAKIRAYLEGKRDSAFLRNLALSALEKGDKGSAFEIAARYIGVIKQPFLRKNLGYIQKFTMHTTDPGFSFLLNNRNKIRKIQGSDAVDHTLKYAIYNSEISKYVDADKAMPDWKIIRLKVIPYGEVGESIFLRSKMIHELNAHRFTEFASTVEKILKKFPEDLTNEDLNNYAWTFFETVGDRELLEIALKWARKSTKNTKRADFIDTYANLLYKTGRANLAIQWEEQAVELSNKEQIFVETLSKMRQNILTWDRSKNLK